MVLGSLTKDEDDTENINEQMEKLPSVIREEAVEGGDSMHNLTQKEKDSKGNKSTDIRLNVRKSFNSIQVNENLESSAGIFMAKRDSSRGYSFSRNQAPHFTEPLLQNALDLVGNMSPQRYSIIKPTDINAPFLALNPPILPIIDNETPSTIYLAPGVSKGPEQQRHAKRMEVDTEEEQDEPW